MNKFLGIFLFIFILLVIIIWNYLKNDNLSAAIDSYNKTFDKISTISTNPTTSTTSTTPTTPNTPNTPDTSAGPDASKSGNFLTHLFTPPALKAMGQQVAFSVGLNLMAKAIDKKIAKRAGQWALKTGSAVLKKLGAKLGSEAMAKLGAKLATKVATNVAAKAGAQIGTKAATAATLGPAGIAVLAFEVVQLGLQIGLDATDAGGYMKMGTLETYYKIRDEINKEFKKSVISQIDEDGKPFPFPQIYGPLDVLMIKNQDGYAAELQQYATNITKDTNEPLMKKFNDGMKDFIASNPDKTETDLDKWISDNFDSLVDMDAIMKKAQSQQCAAHKGVMSGEFCSFATPAECKASMKWPPGSSDDTYVEWDPELKVCVVASTALYDTCASNNISYDWDKRMCAIDQNYCASKGASWGYNDNIKTDDCRISPTQEVFENIFGTTVTRGLIQVFSPNQYCPCKDGQKDEGLICQGCPKEHPHQLGALCYDNDFVSKPRPKRDCPSNMRDDGTSCWLDTYGNGVGTIPDKGPCDPGQRDDRTSCWEDLRCYTNSISCYSLADCIAGRGCGCSGGDTHCSGCGCIKKTLMDRQTCPSGKTKIAGLCYNNCKPGYHYMGGNLCEPDGGPGIKVTAMDRALPCPPGSDNVAGICWSKPYPSTYAKLRKISYSTKDGAGVLTGNC